MPRLEGKVAIVTGAASGIGQATADLFRSEGSEIYLKSIFNYVPVNQACTFEYLTLAARRRGEVLLGIQRYVDDPAQKYGIVLNPSTEFRRTPFVAGQKDRLIVLAEDDG